MSKSNIMHGFSGHKLVMTTISPVSTGLTLTQRSRIDRMSKRLEVRACNAYEAALATQRASMERFTKR